MLNYLRKWMEQLKWQRLAPFEKLAAMPPEARGWHCQLLRDKVRLA